MDPQAEENLDLKGHPESYRHLSFWKEFQQFPVEKGQNPHPGVVVKKARTDPFTRMEDLSFPLKNLDSK